MIELPVYFRNKIERIAYKYIFRPIFFLIDPETTHNGAIRMGKFLGRYEFSRQATRALFGYSHPSLKQEISGISFPNPIGLAAGFDKDAEITDILPFVGFGFMEVGSITGEECEGNAKPRLWRWPEEKSLAVYYGLKNKGSQEISLRLKNKKFKIPLGISIAKTNCRKTISVEEGISDYYKAYLMMNGVASYLTLNISCPNTYGGEPFTNPAALDQLLSEINKLPREKPIFIKLSPDLNNRELDDIIEVAEKHDIAGFICTNLAKDRTNLKITAQNIPAKGSLSGKPIAELSTECISEVYQKTNGKRVIIGSGGVFSAEDAYEKIKAGASLVQIITGMIYEGPQVISEINQGLVRLLKKDGFKNISEAVGVKWR